MPATNVEYWQAKFRQNVKRDRRNVQALLSEEWRVCVVWECAIGRTPDDCLVDEIAAFVRRGDPSFVVVEGAERKSVGVCA